MRKDLQKLLTAVIITGTVSAAANAADTKVEAYAHPTLFGSHAHSYATTKVNYVVGGEVAQAENQISFAGKSNVLIGKTAASVLDVVKTANATANNTCNIKMPVLRSELAVILAESFAMGRKNVNTQNGYKDVTEAYWADKWIETALETNLMIGYPDGYFRPDQQVTKAEVFATIAQIVDVDTSNVDGIKYNGKTIEHIPDWAENCTKETIASGLLAAVPDQDKVISEEYLTKEQVAYLISALKTYLATGKLQVASDAPQVVKDYANATVSMKMNSRVSAKHSNADEVFTAKTTKEVTVNGETFPAGSTVTGRIVEVKRPGVNHPGYVKVKFETIKNGKVKVELPETAVGAELSGKAGNPNIVARICGAPFTATGRVVGIVGRSGAQALNISGDRLEELGDDTSDLLVEPLTAHLGSGIKSGANGVVGVVKGVVDITKTAVSGTFGIVNEVTDELVYLVLPSKSNNAALNPNEEIIVTF